jgi:RNA polymerase sigma factor (sigma-70 family)
MNSDQERLVTQNMSYARGVARKTFRSLPNNTIIDLDDVEALGYQGLVEAATRFDPTKFNGTGTLNDYFRVYAYGRIRGAVIDESRRLAFERRRGIEKGIKFQFLSVDTGTLDLVDAESDRAELMDLLDAIDGLTPREQQVIRGILYGKNQREIAEELGVVESRVSQIATAARKKMEAVL